MAEIVRYLTHPQVRIDPAVPVPEWGLSEVGVARTRALAASRALAGTALVVTSAEAKARETAAILAQALNVPVSVREGLHENDRSATGFLPPAAFEAAADAFFAHPDDSFRGWERASDAQRRVVREVSAALDAAAALRGDILLVGHGGVGTLLMCALAGLAIDRKHDQGPGGGGQVFTFDRATRIVQHRWRPMEAMEPAR
jgi:broad specificity phosphatase PhoE